MSTPSKIVTHPGGAHKDDFLAVCLLLGQFELPVERRDPTPEDLADDTVAVIDVGGEHDPEKLNFDHHQFSREEQPRCAITLILEHLGLLEEARKFCDWLETAEWMDVRGPNVTAGWLEVSREQMARLNSPIDIGMIRRFGSCQELNPGEPLHQVMTWIGADLASYLEGMRGRITLAREKGQRWSLKTKSGETFEVLFYERTEELPDEPSSLMAQWARAEGWQDEIAVLVYPDSRGEGYGMARYQDHPRFDFTRIEGAEGVHFTHASGFLAKTSVTDQEQLKSFIRRAILPESAD